MIGILQAGAYMPRMRLARQAIADAHSWFAPSLRHLAKGEKAFGNWDEDPITMAVEASRDALTGVDRASIARLLLASTTLPFADRQNAGVVKEALDLPDELGVLDVTGSQRAGTSALLAAFDLARTGGRVLCVASDVRHGKPGSDDEMIGADGAGAVLIGEGDVAAELVAAHSVTLDFVDHFRSSGERYDYSWEQRWVREEGYGTIAGGAVRAALAKADIRPASVDRLIVSAPLAGVDRIVAKQAGIAAEKLAGSLFEQFGNAGSAQPLILLAQALETARAGELLVLLGFGQGCDVLIFRAAGKTAIKGLGVSGWLSRSSTEKNYARYLVLREELAIDSGMRAEFDQKTSLTVLYRNRKAITALVGTRCTRTGAVQYPPTPIVIGNNEPSAGAQEPYPLAERVARVVTYTADRLTYTPDPPAHYGAIEFEGGGRMTAEFTDVDATGIEVGQAMRMMFRIKFKDRSRGMTHYFWKAVPDYLAARAPDAERLAVQ